MRRWVAPEGVPSKAELRAALGDCARSTFPPATGRAALLGWAAVIGLGAALWVSAARPSRNLATGKPVTVSSLCKRRPEHSWLNVYPSRLTDGRKWRHFDTCTERTPEPWIAIDLKAPARIERVVVTGQRDCCWAARDLPLLLELSMDGQQFREVARRELPFSDREPWRIDLPGVEGRYLRFHVPVQRPAEIVLTEVEVYGTSSER